MEQTTVKISDDICDVNKTDEGSTSYNWQKIFGFNTPIDEER